MAEDIKIKISEIAKVVNPNAPEKKYLKFSVSRNISTYYTVEKAGLIYYKGEVEELTKETEGAVEKRASSPTNVGTYSVNIEDTGNGITVVGYVVIGGNYYYGKVVHATYEDVTLNQGRNVKILQSIIWGTQYTEPPLSPIETLLLQLKEVIETDENNNQIAYKILNKQNIAIKHSSESRANYNAYLILTQIGIIYIKIVNGEGTAENLAGYSYTATATVSGTTVNIDLGYEWNVGVVVPILGDYIESVTFS